MGQTADPSTGPPYCIGRPSGSVAVSQSRLHRGVVALAASSVQIPIAHGTREERSPRGIEECGLPPAPAGAARVPLPVDIDGGGTCGEHREPAAAAPRDVGPRSDGPAGRSAASRPARRSARGGGRPRPRPSPRRQPSRPTRSRSPRRTRPSRWLPGRTSRFNVSVTTSTPQRVALALTGCSRDVEDEPPRRRVRHRRRPDGRDRARRACASTWTSRPTPPARPGWS